MYNYFICRDSVHFCFEYLEKNIELIKIKILKNKRCNMKTELFNYDVYPKVVKAGIKSTITIKPLGRHAEFPDGELLITIHPLSEGSTRYYPNHKNDFKVTTSQNTQGEIVFEHFFENEQEFFIRFNNTKGNRVQLSIYAVNDDLCGRYPFMGDLHIHSFRSDGKESPEVVAANYRKFGYDFLAVTDHQRYYPSLEAISAYKDIDMDYLLVPGEEVHLPGTDVHIINFGGEYSVNALVETSDHIKDVGRDESKRSNEMIPPSIYLEEEYFAEIEKYADKLDIDCEDSTSYAVCCWAFEHIRNAKGLGIFCHPYWISDVYQVPENLVEYMMEKRPFDAFEVLGGEAYFEQNGLQTIRYYEDRAKHRNYPIVGASDSHGSVNNDNGYVARTIVFAPENEKNYLIGAIKDYYSVAVDGISAELRAFGDIRLVRYAWFLITNYFPLHDDLCYEEGRLMKAFVCGDKDAGEKLKKIGKQMIDFRKKYFAW
jgi:hypothetical protein